MLVSHPHRFSAFLFMLPRRYNLHFTLSGPSIYDHAFRCDNVCTISQTTALTMHAGL